MRLELTLESEPTVDFDPAWLEDITAALVDAGVAYKLNPVPTAVVGHIARDGRALAHYRAMVLPE